MASAYTFLSVVLHVTIVAGDKQMNFVTYKDQSMVAVTPVRTFNISTPLMCHEQCLRRPDCVAVAVSGSTCSLYDTSVTEPENQLQSQQGTVLYSQAMSIDVISVTLDESNAKNTGSPNFFPQLAAIRNGRVVKWEVRCATAGTVWLSMWRTMDSVTSIQLIGRHLVTVSDAMVNQIVEYEVPKDDEFDVQAGDFVGFYYGDVAQALVRIVRADSNQDLTIEASYKIRRVTGCCNRSRFNHHSIRTKHQEDSRVSCAHRGIGEELATINLAYSRCPHY